MVNLSSVFVLQSILVADEKTLIPTDEKVEGFIKELKEDDQCNEVPEQINVVLQQLKLGEQKLRFHSAFAIENTKRNFSVPEGILGGILGVDGSFDNLDSTVASNLATALKKDSDSSSVIGGDKLKAPDKKINISGDSKVRSKEQSLNQGTALNKSGSSELMDRKDNSLSLPAARKITSDELHHKQSADLNSVSRPEIISATIHRNAKSEDVMMRPMTHQSFETLTSNTQLDGALLYKFRSWGHEHVVRIVPPALNGGDGSATFLQPSSALVEQRLNAYGGMTESGDRWQLQEYRDPSEERKEQRSQDEWEEDNA